MPPPKEWMQEHEWRDEGDSVHQALLDDVHSMSVPAQTHGAFTANTKYDKFHDSMILWHCGTDTSVQLHVAWRIEPY